MNIDMMLAAVLKNEGGYVNNPNDKGGETNFGITIDTARRNGYAGDMREITRAKAIEIYRLEYFIRPGFDLVAALSSGIALELFDTGVNMGPIVPIKWLQRCLNAINRAQKDFPDLLVDGRIGTKTVAALSAYLQLRGDEGEHRLLTALNACQGYRYLELCEGREANETFFYGWLDRVRL